LALQVGGGALRGEPSVILRSRANVGRLGLGLGPDLALHLVGGQSRLLEDAGGLVAGVGHLTPVLRQLLLGLGARSLGALEIVTDPLLAALHHVAHRGQPELPQHAEQHHEGETTPDDLVASGDERVRGLLAVVDLLALFEELDALLLCFALRLRMGDAG
jgi:hypothetical protein